jgi:hypothetical protein
LFTIFKRIGGRSKNGGDGGTAVLRKKDERERRAVKRENGKDKFFPLQLQIKGDLELGHHVSLSLFYQGIFSTTMCGN